LTIVGKYATITMKIYFDNKAYKEYKKLSREVRFEFDSYMQVLEIKRWLMFPEGKKIKDTDIWEMRVRLKGQWRGFYAYLKGNEIIVLRFFRKKTQRTPIREIKITKNRLKFYK
jgi:phage-related protein